ncbi:uncharacterized protein LOC143514210 [Brachyhypopomus gauderio]|uniref:uncharacterized protein LOC143514210 n=1 Tax=Brachyhypopomus gauderio TaxID=698409 RepID=UPI004042743E
MEQLWHVVEFADKSTAVVPTSWVQNRQCLWPPRDSVNIHRAVKQQIKPSLDWTVHEQIRCLATCDTYEKAIDCLKRSVEPGCATTDIESEQENAERRKRISKPNPKYNIYMEAEEECTRKTCIPKSSSILSPDFYQSYRVASDVLDHTWPEGNLFAHHSNGESHHHLQKSSSCDNDTEVQPQPRQMLRDIGLSKVVQMLAQNMEENRDERRN